MIPQTQIGDAAAAREGLEIKPGHEDAQGLLRSVKPG